jgi:lipopolysaccharide transport system permease protein
MSRRKELIKSFAIMLSYYPRVSEAVVHDIRQRYVGSLFGIVWAVLFPLLQLSIYAIVYIHIFHIRPSGLSEFGYVLLIFSGLCPLMAFGEILNASTASLISNKNLLLNTVFPAELIPVRAAISSQVTSFMAMIITLLIGFMSGYTPWYSLLLAPFFWILLIMFGIGLGWMLSLISLVARDVQHGLGLVIMIVFILSPFAFTPDMVPSALRLIIYFNPLSYFVLVFQKLICYGVLPDAVPAIGAIFLGLTSFFIGFAVFQKAKYIFFDYV